SAQTERERGSLRSAYQEGPKGLQTLRWRKADSNFQFRADRETERSSTELPLIAAVLIEPHQRACVGERADLPKRVIAAAEPMRVLFAG
ncbi:MAG TPA: hypothetical protein VE687_10770, partial [Stellaceae bacterium]|nr:hypothetical protein [Stellaceae bacterium]